MSKYIACTICNRAEEYTTKLYTEQFGNIPYKCTICCGGKMDPNRALHMLIKETQTTVDSIDDKYKEKIFTAIGAYHGALLEPETKMIWRIKAEVYDVCKELGIDLGNSAYVINIIESGNTSGLIDEWLKGEPDEYDGEADLDPVPTNNGGD